MESMSLKPFRSLMGLQEEMNRIFDDFWGRSRTGELKEYITPAIDMEESDKEIIIKAELPGVEPEQIQLSISGNNLIIKGERKLQHEEKRKNYHIMECSYGSFYRSVTLPVEVDTDKIDAIYKKGILNIILKKSKKALPRQIKIDIKK